MSDATARFDYELTPERDRPPAVGLIVLAEDATIEDEWRWLIEPGEARVYVSRIPCDADISPQSLAAMAPQLSGALDPLTPGSRLDALAYACTSGALVLGEETVAGALNAHRPGVPVTTPLGAARAALSALGAARIALLTPYSESVNQPLRDHLEATGFEVRRLGSFFNPHDPDVARISAASIRRAAERMVDGAGVEALFIACTALRAAALVPALEDALGIAVTTSSHAMAWHALHLAGVRPMRPARGRLFGLSTRA